MKDIEKLLNLIRKYGVGAVLLGFFLWQYTSVVQEKNKVIELYQKTLMDNVSVMIKIDESLKMLPTMESELRELRYEQRRLTDIMQLPSKRYDKE